MLKDNEILELIDRYQREDDQEAFNKLYKEFTPLIKKITYSRIPMDFKEEYEDVVQTSSLAFVSAVRTYRTDKNCTFVSYVYGCIINATRHYLRDELTLVKYPARTSITEKCALKSTSLDKHRNHDHEQEKDSFLTQIQDPQNIEDELTWKVSLEKVLNDEEKDLLYNKYILEKTQHELASMYGISQALVNRKVKRIHDRMKVIFNG